MNDEAEVRRLIERHGIHSGMMDEHSDPDELAEIQKDLGIL